MANKTNLTPGARHGSRDNNFAFIRIAAACSVFMGHMGIVLGIDPPYIAGITMHELGVMTLFLIGGYLITKSWLSDPHPARYAVRRFFRLWPPFAAYVLLMVFVAGPLLSDLGARGYFDGPFTLYLRNLRFSPVYYQPGVFEHVPEACSTNGSLWTMPVEAVVYILTPFFLTLIRAGKNPKWSLRVTAALSVAAIAVDVFLRTYYLHARYVVYGTDLVASHHILVMYLIGILFTYEEVRKYLNLQAACGAVWVLLLFQMTADPLRHLVLYLLFPYVIFSFAFAPGPVFHKMGRKIELSYGIYLYGFFFQQLVVSLLVKYQIDMSYSEVLFLSAVPTLAAAALSYYLVERPMVRLGQYLVRKLRR